VKAVSSDLYGGIAGATLKSEAFRFPAGVMLRATYTHLMAHFILAFKKPAPGAHHPAPWKSAHSGMAFDVEMEIQVPGDLAPDDWFDTLNTIWWTAALLRLRVSPNIRVPVFAATSFASMAEVSGEAQVRVLEVQDRSLVKADASPAVLAAGDLSWAASRWLSGGRLFRAHPNFGNAFVAFDQSIWSSTFGMGLVQLWGAFELLFATTRFRKTAQLASRISAYLEPPGEDRDSLKKRVQSLYGSRSDAAHGNPNGQEEAYLASFALLRHVLVKMLDDDYVLSVDDLERLSQPGAEHRVH
jgi:hypothetical protein